MDPAGEFGDTMYLEFQTGNQANAAVRGRAPACASGWFTFFALTMVDGDENESRGAVHFFRCAQQAGKAYETLAPPEVAT